MAEFNPALATLAASPEHEDLLATEKALTGNVREDADVIITNRALAAEGGESPHARAVRVLAEEDFLSPGEAEGAALAVEEYRRSLKKNKGKKGKKCKKGKKGRKCRKGKKALKAKAKKLRKQAKALIAKAKALEKKANGQCIFHPPVMYYSMFNLRYE
ncbi:unnamed protein product [Closterium sp. Naga37s-1]|nr:unnamed protein product [Closterium sp. Naga37s-1]